jgi:hypothetical protein
MEKTPMSLADVYVTHLRNQERPDDVTRHRMCRRHSDVLNKTKSYIKLCKMILSKNYKMAYLHTAADMT